MIIVDITQGIQVGGFHFDVDTSGKAHRMLLADRNCGEVDLLHHVISLDTTLDPEQISKTFLHEAIEAVVCYYCDNKVEHERIEQLSFGLHQVMVSLGVRFGK